MASDCLRLSAGGEIEPLYRLRCDVADLKCRVGMNERQQCFFVKDVGDPSCRNAFQALVLQLHRIYHEFGEHTSRLAALDRRAHG